MTHKGPHDYRRRFAALPRIPGFARTGFTLIELVLVMAIIAICAMIAAPQLAGSTRARALPLTATDFVTIARWCRVQAIMDGTQYRLNLDPSTGRWWVTKDDGSGVTFAQVTQPMGQEFKIPDSITMTSKIPPVNGEIYIGFAPGGRSDTGSVIFSYARAQIEVGSASPLGSYHILATTGGQ